MIDETLKIEELQLITDKFIELNIYFLDKIHTKDISDYDKERYNDITNKFSFKIYEYIKNTTNNLNKNELKSSVNFQIEKFEDNIKNS